MQDIDDKYFKSPSNELDKITNELLMLNQKDLSLYFSCRFERNV